VPKRYFKDGGTLVSRGARPGKAFGGYLAIIGLKSAMNTTTPMKTRPARAALFFLNLRHAIFH
jgi:hypothetical protein